MSLVCLQAPVGDTSVVFSNFGLGSSALVQGAGWDATLGLMVDSRQTAGELWKVCDDSLCADYRTDCKPDTLTCTFTVRGGPSGLTTIVIRAESKEAFAIARTSLAVIVDRQALRGLRLDRLSTMDELKDAAIREREAADEAEPDSRRIAAERAAEVERQRQRERR